MGLRALAAQLVEAVAEAMPFVTELPGEPAGVEVGAAGTVFVDRPAVRPLRARLVIEFGQRAQRGELQDGAQQVVRIGRAARDGDDGLALEYLRRAFRAGGIRIGGGNAAP